MLGLITKAFSAIAALFGFGEKAEEASTENTAEANGVTAQVATDEKATTDVLKSELAADASAVSGPSDSQLLHSGKA